MHLVLLEDSKEYVKKWQMFSYEISMYNWNNVFQILSISVEFEVHWKLVELEVHCSSRILYEIIFKAELPPCFS